MPLTGEPAHDGVANQAWQQSQVDVLATKLARAERAVAQARTAAAAADAHRRADALLLELEDAEDQLRALNEPAPRKRRATRADRSPLSGQGHLFDVG